MDKLMSNEASIDILNAWDAETTTDNADELALRQREFEDYQRELNATRLMSDGPDQNPVSMKRSMFIDRRVRRPCV